MRRELNRMAMLEQDFPQQLRRNWSKLFSLWDLVSITIWK